MHDDFLQSLKQAISRLGVLLIEDPPLRAALRKLAETVIELDRAAVAADSVERRRTEEELTPQPVAEQRDAPTVAAADEPEKCDVLPASAAAALLSGMGDADGPIESAPPRSYWAPVSDADLPLIETRCRLKAEGVRWSLERSRALEQGAERWEVADRDRELIDRARQIENCYLWMNRRDWLPPMDTSLVENLAGCFDAAADAVSLVRALQSQPAMERGLLEPALDLLAEAQSALRAAVHRTNDRDDADQTMIYAWLRDTARQRQIVIQRYMRLNDPADPAAWPDLAARISELDNQLQAAGRCEKEQRRLLNKIRYLVNQISQQPEHAQPHWQTLDRTVEEMAAQGVLPNNRELREELLKIIDWLPDIEDLSPAFAQCIREADRFLAAQSSGESLLRERAWSHDVAEVAELLAGRTLVLIGGERRPAAHDALVQAFRLRDLEWVSTRDHLPLARFEPAVARPDAALVLLAIRWSSHSYGEVQRMCDHYGKPFVRLPGGYNPNQVAAQILAQCGDRLREGITACS